jgi:hypothetical protein
LNGYLEVTRALLPHGTTAINETGEFDNKLTNQERLLDVLRLFEQKKNLDGCPYHHPERKRPNK